jgi:hypothetical protein
MVGPWGLLSGFLVAATIRVEGVDGGPLGVLAAGLAAATTDVEDVDGGPPGGYCQDFMQRPPPELKTSIVGPLGVLAASPAATTTDVEDVNGRPHVGARRQVRQRRPPELKTSMAGPLRPWRYEVGSIKKMLAVTSDPRGVPAQSSHCLRRATNPTHNYRPWVIQCSSSRGGEQGVGQRCPPSGPPAANSKASRERSTHA